jgi:4-amino-4-deoxy-L-arabinose transferase-like glycosyltransferase
MRDRARDYALLLAASVALTLPNLGRASLWDEDEGVNAQAAREMRDGGTWVIPTFNYQLRTAKPVMLYWLQRTSYAAFGVSEWSARLPSVVAGWLAVLLTYELGRRMFGRGTGLVAGVALASVFQFGLLAHAATPDATLLLFTTLAYLAFWTGHLNSSHPATREIAKASERGSGGRRWFVPTAAACGLAVLTKGPVGVALPGLVVLLYFAWNRELGRLLDRRLAWAALVFVLVAGPWYALVANETRGEWVRTFIGRENVHRFGAAMDGHGGPAAYYLVALPVMFAPWSAFILPVIWYGVRGARRESPSAAESPGTAVPGLSEAVRAHRFLVCWVGAYLVVFSAAATKLPNYIFPAYPAVAILTARFLVGWRDGVFAVPRWVMWAATGGMAFVAAGFAAGLLLANRVFPGLGGWAALGLVPLAGAAGMAWALRWNDRAGLVTAAAVASVAFLGLAVALPPGELERWKAPKELVRASGVGDPSRDLRLAAIGWLPPSVVYYSGREVTGFERAEDAAAFLEVPTPGYLFVPEPVWKQSLEGRVTVPVREAARHRDFLGKYDILVVTNDMAGGDVAAR